MIHTLLLRLIVLTAAIPAISAAGADSPTSLTPPAGAQQLRAFAFNDGDAFQTEFLLHAEYPNSSAIEHFRRLIGPPWSFCTWGRPGWQQYVDGTGPTAQGIHQQLRMWVNPAAGRTLTMRLYYESPYPLRDKPVSDEQRIIVVEYFHQDARAEASRRDLHCEPPL